ncbi:hypothetical protein Hypma_012988 [Hypsizygus marmoreus]|uniref:F-box domain-containing protein n=1 Tax=Hypsizygus marmoreus TaxID=39966 RepID=A0A369JDP8_HYPMA|nr:hypothetical protein Hypma_012988 [Hypsizygus marmoreus]
MLRRSTRIKTRVGNGAGKASVSTKPKPSKRRRTTKAVPVEPVEAPVPVQQTAGLRGKLKQLTEIPLELLFEVFSHLNPGDLLHLTWSCTTLREMIMRKSSAYLWKRARDNVGLPDCHPDLNEAQFAKLIFNHRCYYCQCVNAQTMLWEIGTRACKKCLSDPNKFDSDTSRFAIPKDIIPMVERPGRLPYGYCCRYTKRLNDYYLTLDDQGKTQWVQMKRMERQSRYEHTQLCEDWFYDWYDHVVAEKAKIRLRRCDAIEEKLHELGWGEELEKMREDDYTILDLPFVKQAKDLTEESWNKKEADMIDLMKRIKEKRLASEYRAIQKERRGILLDLYLGFVASQPVDAILPGPADIVFMPKFKAVIDLPRTTAIIADDFAISLQDLPKLIQDWRNKADAKLVSLINTTDSSLQATEAFLDLPTTLFRCRACGSCITYPRVLVHRCFTLVRCSYSHEHYAIFHELRCQPWAISSDILFDDSATKNAASLLSQLKMTVDSASTKALLEDPNFFIRCIRCGYRFEQAVMTWETAIKHPSECRSSLRRARLDEKDLAILKDRIAEKERSHRRFETQRHWKCLFCRKMFTWDNLVAHITETHRDGAESPLIDSVDYSLDTDLRVEVRSGIFKIPKKADAPAKNSVQSETAKATAQHAPEEQI